jgi:hypothetical protein
MSGEYCTPLIPRPKGVTAEDFARILAPETRTSYYPSKGPNGVENIPDTAPHCAGPNEAAECPTVLLLHSMRSQGLVSQDFKIPYRLHGCLYAHSQP